MYEESGNKVTLVAHSMGGPVSLYFLNTDNGIVTQQWKDKYLHAYITLSGDWAGSLLSIREAVSGFSSGLPLSELFFRTFSRTYESGVWFLPDPDVFKSTIVSTPERTYTAEDYVTIFDDTQYPVGTSMYEGVKKISKKFPGPKVPTYCYWGLGTPTPISYHYNKSFPVDAGYDPSNTTYSDGDGKVDNVTSILCLKWADDIVESKTFEGVTHDNMIKNYTIFDAIAEVVTNLTVTVESKFGPKLSDDKHTDGIFNNMMYHGATMYCAIKRMIKIMVQKILVN